MSQKVGFPRPTRVFCFYKLCSALFHSLFCAFIPSQMSNVATCCRHVFVPCLNAAMTGHDGVTHPQSPRSLKTQRPKDPQDPQDP